MNSNYKRLNEYNKTLIEIDKYLINEKKEIYISRESQYSQKIKNNFMNKIEKNQLFILFLYFYIIYKNKYLICF